MNEKTRMRWIQLAIALALIAVIALTGLGLKALAAQSRLLGKVLFNAASDTAEGRIIPKIQDAIAGVESQALDALIAMAGHASPIDAESIEALQRQQPAIDTPFLLASDFTYLFPRPRPETGISSLLEPALEAAPEDFQNAMRLLWSGAPAVEAHRALESIYRAPELASPLRLRALAALASLELRDGRPVKAEECYRKLFQEFAQDLKGPTTPSCLQLSMARSEALRAGDRIQEGLQNLRDTLQKLVSDQIPTSGQEEEEFFIQTTVDWFQRAIAPGASTSPPPLLDAAGIQPLLQLYRDRTRKMQFSRTLKDWILTRIRITQDMGEGSAGPQRFSESFADARYLIIWRSDVPLASGTKLAAVGFRFHPEILRQILDETLFKLNSTRSGEPGGDLDHSEGLQFRIFGSAGAVPDEAEGELPSVHLPSPFQHLRLGVDQESWRRHLQESRRPFQFAGALIPALGAGMALALITFYRAYRRERLLSNLKTDFVANVSHELKTPLALIRMFGETLLLDRVQDPGKQKEYYRIIARESERLTHLINNVLNFASIEAGKKKYDLRPTDIAGVVLETLQAYQFEIEQKGFRLDTDIAAGLPSIPADPDGIAQALINLLNNSVKYSTDEKHIAIRLRLENGALLLSVSDRGVGIAKEDLKRIFEGFYRAETARKLGSRGSGLGLPLVRHIVESHGGRIEIDSAPGSGSTFTLIFPCPPPAPRK